MKTKDRMDKGTNEHGTATTAGSSGGKYLPNMTKIESTASKNRAKT